MAKLSINYPVYRHVAQVTLGRGSLRGLECLAQPDTAFFLSSSESVRERLHEAAGVGAADIGSRCFVKPQGEPTAASVRAGAKFLAGRKAARIVAIGGGSVLDLARLAAAEALQCLDLVRGAIDPPAAVTARPEIVLVPTTCGTGAEAADVVVYTDDDGVKRSIVSRWFAADRAVLDGRMLDSLEPASLAAFVCDASSHCIESYASIVPNALAKDSAVSALSVILSNFRPDAGPHERDRLLEASFLAGTAAANCSVGIVHAFAHSIGAAGLSHGLANACGLEAGIEFNRQTPQLNNLVHRLGMDDVDELLAAIGEITKAALTGARAREAIIRLIDPHRRRELAEQMARDVAIRTNPRRPSPEDRHAFVERIYERLQST